jgi:hypothetical protein
MQDGYFHRDRMKGIWLAGDYFDPSCLKRTDLKTKGQAFVRIDTINDCDQTKTPPFCGSAENTTSKEMARLFLNILLEELVDQPSSQEMKAILREAENGSPAGTPPPIWPRAPDFSFLDFDPGTGRASGDIDKKFRIDGVKIGQGPIKPDLARGRNVEVRSEGLIITWNNLSEHDRDFDPELKKNFDKFNLTGEAAICWQNLSTALDDTDGIIEIINDSIDNFINQAPLTP